MAVAPSRPRPRFAFVADAVSSRRFPIATLIVLFALSWLVWAWIGTRHYFPNLFPDEIIYAKLSQSFAAGHGLAWRGDSFGLPPLWPILMSPGWHLGSLRDGWYAIRLAQVGLTSLVVFPAWVIAQTLVDKRLALVAAGLAAAGSWMSVTSFVLSENFTYPVATASIAAMVVALQTTRMRWILVSLAFAALACAARTQMLVLPVALVVALILDVAIQGKDKRRARFGAWPWTLWAGLILGVGGMITAFILEPHLTNYQVGANPEPVTKVFAASVHHGGDVLIAAAFIPALAFFALALDGKNWRDRQLGPVLVLTVSMLLTLLPLLGRFEAYATQGATVERYSMYVMPLMMALLVVAPGRVTRRRTLIAGLALLALLLVVPHTHNAIEQPALFGTQRRLAFMLGIFGGHLRPTLVLFALPIVAVGGLALTSRHRVLGLSVAILVTAGVMIVQSSGYHNRLISIEAISRAGIAPKHFDWVDRAGRGPVDMLAIGVPESIYHSVDAYTPFFNRRIRNDFMTVPTATAPPGCNVKVGPDGVLHQTSGWCTRWSRHYLLVASPTHATLRNEHVVLATPTHGWLITTPPGPPRLLSLVTPPCDYGRCTGALNIGFYLTKSAVARITFAGASVPHSLKVGNTVETLAAGRNTSILVRLPKANASVSFPVDWTTPDGPVLTSVLLTSEGKTTRIY